MEQAQLIRLKEKQKEQHAKLAMTLISSLKLSKSTIGALTDNGIMTVDQLILMNSKQIESIKGLDPLTVRIILQSVRRMFPGFVELTQKVNPKDLGTKPVKFKVNEALFKAKNVKINYRKRSKVFIKEQFKHIKDEMLQKILSLHVDGLVLNSIAIEIGVSHQTVRNNLTKAYDDYGCKNLSSLIFKIMSTMPK